MPGPVFLPSMPCTDDAACATAAYDDFVAQYRATGLLSAKDVRHLEEATVRNNTIMEIAAFRLTRRFRLMMTSPDSMNEDTVAEGFVRVHLYRDASCLDQAHDVYLPIGPCDTHQLLWGNRYGGSVRMLFQRGSLLAVHFRSPLCHSSNSKISAHPLHKCSRVHDDMYIIPSEFEVRPAVRMYVVKNADPQRAVPFVKAEPHRIFPDGRLMQFNLQHNKLGPGSSWIRVQIDRATMSVNFLQGDCVTSACTEKEDNDRVAQSRVPCGKCMRVTFSEAGPDSSADDWCFSCSSRADVVHLLPPVANSERTDR